MFNMTIILYRFAKPKYYSIVSVETLPISHYLIRC